MLERPLSHYWTSPLRTLDMNCTCPASRYPIRNSFTESQGPAKKLYYFNNDIYAVFSMHNNNAIAFISMNIELT